MPFSFFDNTFLKGGDIESLHLPAVFYLSQKLNDYQFPFWTEKLYSGFPIYVDGEMGYFNPLRLMLVFLVQNPLLSIKIEFLIIYLIGSLFLIKLLETDFKFNFLQIVISHLIIFFGVPVVVRLLHLNIIYSYYLIPLNLYLLSCYLKSARFRYLVFRSLVFSFVFSYGNYNALFLGMLIEFFYLCFVSKSTLNSKLKYFFFSGLLSIIACLPMLIPSFFAFSKSVRVTDLDFTEGSYSPLFLLNMFNPFLLGAPDNFVGSTVSPDWYPHESYIYFGISVFVIGIYVYLNKNYKNYMFILVSLYLFVILSNIKYFQYSNLLNFPPINLFRYWGRSSLILLFSLGITVPEFFNNRFEFKFDIKRVYYLTPLFLFFIFNLIKSISSYENLFFINAFKTTLFSTEKNILVWKIIIALFIVVFIVNLIKSNKYLRKILYILLLLDVIFISLTFLKFNNAEYSNFINLNLLRTSKAYSNQRVVFFDNSVMGNRPLLYPVWGIHGYLSAFEENSYKEYFSKNNLSIRRAKSINEVSTHKEFYKNLGVTSIITLDNTQDLNLTNDLFQGPSLSVYYLQKDEGVIKAEIHSNTSQKIRVLLKQNDNWQFKVNGNKINLPKDYSFFYTLEISQGLNSFEAKYVPNDFYLGVILTIFLYPISLFLIRKYF